MYIYILESLPWPPNSIISQVYIFLYSRWQCLISCSAKEPLSIGTSQVDYLLFSESNCNYQDNSFS